MSIHPHDPLWETMHLSNQLRKTVRRSFALAMADCPKCHFPMLERLHFALQSHGVDGCIYVSDLAAAVREPLPAVSRTIRMLEREGLVGRRTDPADRRKTFVFLTPAGDEARRTCETAVADYLHQVLDRLGPAHLAEMTQSFLLLEAAFTAQNEDILRARGQPPDFEPEQTPATPDFDPRGEHPHAKDF